MSTPLEGIVFWFPAFLFSVTLHETAHAWAARRGGDSTASVAGYATLNPLLHMRRSPIGMLVVPVVTTLTWGWTMGWASVPHDRLWAERYPRRAAWMAAAGPGANLVLALCALLLLFIGLQAGIFASPSTVSFGRLAEALPGIPAGRLVEFLARMLSVLATLNGLMFAFNLLPIAPLDGASAITLVLPDSWGWSVRGWSRSSYAGVFGLMTAWWLFPAMAEPVFRAVVGLLYPGLYVF